MKLHEIIEVNENIETSIEWGILSPYKKTLYTYYKSLFCCEPILMVTSITNNSCYMKIVHENDFLDALYEYTINSAIDPEDQDSLMETISFNSKFMKDLL